MDMRHDDEHLVYEGAAPRPGPSAGPSVADGLDSALSVFLAERTRLHRIAYRVTGNRAEAEEVVQEVWLRWQRTDRREIRNAAAFLTTATTHLAINVIQSARVRHATTLASPLPEREDANTEAADSVERAAAVEDTLLVVFTRLGPAERAAYVLRKAFDYPYGRIAEVLQTTAANARQLVRRAQVRIERGRTREVDRTSYRCLVDAFLTAARTGRMDVIERVLVGDLERPVRCADRDKRAPGGTHELCRA
jgi:RNA polymerase sigma-70 factor (ECF subfamily)